MDRPGNVKIQLDLLLSYGGKPPLYPQWEAYFREHQPPMLIAWGKNDPIFPGAEAGEVTAVEQLAMLSGLPWTALRDGLIAHPTLDEGLDYLFGSAIQ